MVYSSVEDKISPAGMSFSKAASHVSCDVYDVTDVTFEDLRLTNALNVQVPAGVGTMLQLAGQVPQTNEAAARLLIDPVALHAQDGVPNTTLTVERSSKLLTLHGSFLRGPIDYVYVNKDNDVIGVIEAKSAVTFANAASEMQLYLELLAEMFGDIEDHADSLSVKCMWGFLSDGQHYTLLVLDHFHRVLRVQSVTGDNAFWVIRFLLTNTQYLSTILSDALKEELRFAGLAEADLA